MFTIEPNLTLNHKCNNFFLPLTQICFDRQTQRKEKVLFECTDRVRRCLLCVLIEFGANCIQAR